MLAAALILFRETLEASLIVAIIAVATRGVAGRGRWIGLGLLGGAVASGIVAALAEAITNLGDGIGQELLNAGILLTAVLMIGWHVVWMGSHGRALASQMRQVGKQVTAGESDISVLAVVIGLAVLREGSEVVLLLQGLLTGQTGGGGLLAGSALGFGLGALTGVLMYAGFLALPVQRVFTATNALLVLIAAGMAARGVNFLVQAGWLPSLTESLWDTSEIIAEDSILGQILATLIGYISQPSGIQVLAYLTTVGVIMSLLAFQKRRTVAAALALFGLALLAPHAAQAASVKSPYVVKGETEIENKGFLPHNDGTALGDEGKYEFSVSHGVTDFWKTELEAELEKEKDKNIKHTVTKWENTLQLTDQGEYWVDPALYAEIAWGGNDEPDAFTGGLVLGKDIGQTSHLANILLGAKSGAGADKDLIAKLRWQSLYRLTSWAQPGFESFYDSKGVSHFRDQELTVGPVVAGSLPGFAEKQKISYELGYQFGTTDGSPDGAVRWKVEYEFYF